MPKQIVSATPGSLIEWEELKGKLLVIEPLDAEKDIKTVHGISDAVRVNLYALLGPDKSDDYEDTLVFPRVLQGQLRRKIGALVVGRLTQGEAKRGQSAPWLLAEANEKDLKRAQDFVAKKFTESAAPADAANDDFDDDSGADEDAF